HPHPRDPADRHRLVDRPRGVRAYDRDQPARRLAKRSRGVASCRRAARLHPAACPPALPHVAERRGYILPIASLAAALHLPLMAHYAATKAGVEAFADSLRGE